MPSSALCPRVSLGLCGGRDGLAALLNSLDFQLLTCHTLCLPAAEYGQIKLVAGMVNTRALWFAPGGGAGQQGAAPAAAENRPSNGAPSAVPEAKRQRLSSGVGAQPAQQQQQQLPQLDRAAVVAWLAGRGGATGAQLVQQFCGGADDQPLRVWQQRLVGLLEEMCADFEVVRKGGNSAASSTINLDDAAVQFMPL